MHGIIHLELRKFIQARHGPEGWLRLLEQAGVATSLGYVRVGQYPDDELAAILAAAARKTGAAVEAILEDFGEFSAADLIAMYPGLVKPEWRTLDLLLHVEQTIHQVVRLRNAGARPPLLRCARPTAEEVVITYTSPRRLCALARGIIRGVARHYGEPVTITETTCMHRGAEACTISIRVQEVPPA